MHTNTFRKAKSNCNKEHLYIKEFKGIKIKKIELKHVSNLELLEDEQRKLATFVSLSRKIQLIA